MSVSEKQTFYTIRTGTKGQSKVERIVYTIPDVATFLEELWDGQSHVRIDVGVKNVKKLLTAHETELETLKKRVEWLKQETAALKSINGSGPEPSDG